MVRQNPKARVLADQILAQGLDKVLKSLEKALTLGLVTKLNVVAMKGINDDEIVDFVRMTKAMPIEVRFIEYMPFGGQPTPWTSSG